MRDAFTRFLDELGEELFGAQWAFYRPHVQRWAATNPERVAWLEARMRAYAEAMR
ncbi:MAG: hypothetical protein ACYDBQ_03490 [Thermoplasmatota archaeon]